jgi:hypothetical protein
MLVRAGAPFMPVLPPFMFWQLCVGLLEADGEGVAAVLADPALTAVVAAPDDDDVDDVTEDVCAVAALATARLPPSPTPSAPAPIAVVIAILPSLVFNVSASSRSGLWPCTQDTRAGCALTAAIVC